MLQNKKEKAQSSCRQELKQNQREEVTSEAINEEYGPMTSRVLCVSLPLSHLNTQIFIL